MGIFDVDIECLEPLIPEEEVKRLRVRLLTRLREHFFPGRSEAMPIACRINSTDCADEVQESWLEKSDPLIVYMENYDSMIRTTATAVMRMLNDREPWQDFDLCIFDEDMDWCVALTHNDEAKRVKLA